MKILTTFWGKVIAGKKRGKRLGFPTANIRLHKRILEGIYAAKTVMFGKEYLSACFIGAAKTFGEKDVKAEVYILNFNKNIYGKWISVRLVQKIRDNKSFQSEKNLITQMHEDVKEIERFFSHE